MPTVIKQPEQKVVECNKCRATIGYVYTEVSKDYTTDYLGGKSYYNYVLCPCCVNRIHVKG